MWKSVLIVFSALFAFEAGAQLMGGWTTIDISDPGAQNALNFAVAQHNKGTNDMYVYKPTVVTKVQRQLVAGYKYIINALMERTSCRKQVAAETCDTIQDSPLARSMDCTFTVWYRPWDNFIKVTDQSCQTSEQPSSV
ncbi:cystatin C (amyloid angiopathy and cerebral hemorrhage) [Betta splendens]|uniref:Cystatin C (Amyloid angiopathy and cerebral hemorrhage) n=1 Tax=Betta splendens TaxID=158456 RepID=A0A6P7Q292_BETSP|nr:cystatin C (amyloid angiopathy and cerebral hemorrhage) [Betta splendens]